MALINYQNGLEQGIATTFFDNGGIKTEGAFDQGQQNSLWLEYYPNGVFFSIAEYQNGNLEGEYPRVL